jgi:ankyrin repeat protein
MAIGAAIVYGQAESVRVLLEAGHDPDEKIEYNPWTFGFNDCCPGRSFCTAAHFCIKPPSIDASQNPGPSRQQIGPPQIGCLEVLLREGGADANARNSGRMTPLILLASTRPIDDDLADAARDLLLEAGARTSGVFDEDDRSPLAWAAASGNVRLTRFLPEEARVPVDEREPEYERTALHSCQVDYATETAALLLDAGADVNARDWYGRSPLFSFLQEAASILLFERRLCGFGRLRWLHAFDDVCE